MQIMKRSDVLKQERASKIEEQGALLETRKNEKRDAFTEAETSKFNTLDEEIRSLDGKIEQAEREEAAEARAAQMVSRSAAGAGSDSGEAKEKKQIQKRASVLKAIRNATAGRALEGAEAEMNEIAKEENRAAGVETPDNAKVSIPMSFLRATAQTVSEDSGSYGGKLVVDQAPRVQMGFSPASVLEDLGATVWTGLQGGDIPLPVLNDYTFSWLTETGAITPQKKEIDGPSLNPKRLGAAVELSNRLLIQSSVDVEALVRQKILAGYNAAINEAAINGGATNEPKGILNITGIPTGTGTAAQVPTKKLVAELVKLVREANATGARLGFLGSPEMNYLLETTPIDAGSGLFLKDKLNELLGYKFTASTHVPQLNDGVTDNEVLIFGDWSQMFVGQWGSISILTDPYSASLNNSVRLVLNGHADVQVAQKGAFAFNKFFNEVE